MIRDITIGQYYPIDSVLHRLDPRVKLIGTILYVLSLFFIRNFAGYAVAALFLAVMIKMSRVPLGYIVRGLRVVVFLFLFTTFLNLFWTPGEPLWKYGVLTVTKEGVYRSVFMIFRLVFLIIGSSLMTLTTTPNQLTDALESVLSPLSKIKVPVHEIAMMMSIALRFIPILIEETDKIMKAQMARGADFEKGNLIKRAKNMLPLLVPLFVSASRRAAELAMAMDARCYHGGEGRTKMKPLRYKKQDIAAYLIVAAYLAGIGLQNLYNWGL